MTGRWGRRVLGAEISRRAFLKAAGAAAVLAASGTLGCAGPQAGMTPTGTPTAGPTVPSPTVPSPTVPSPTVTPSGKVVVATDADPARLVDRALDAYGGLSGIIRPGDHVIVKANFSWAYTPEQGGCNCPGVLARVMQRCKEAGAGDVTAIDHTIDNAQLCLDRSGIRKAVEDAGLQALAVRSAGDFEDRAVDGVALKAAGVPRLLRDADVLINVPAVKSHGNTLMTAGMKNLMGLVLDSGGLHNGRLDQNIVDLAALFRPDLTIADAYLVVRQNGPRGSRDPGDLSHPQQVVVSDDIVAVDAYCTRYLDLRPEDVLHVKLAAEGGLGQMDLGKVNVVTV